MVGAIHRALERHVLAGSPGAEPAGGERQIDVDPFIVEILDALGRVVIAARRRLAAFFRAGEAGHIGALVRLGGRGAELAQVAPLSLGVNDALGVFRLEGLPRRELRFLLGREVALEHIHVRADVRVGIENAVAVSRHGAF